MRVAALYDIHGNLPALEAVLQDVRREGITDIVIGGDVVLGPMPRETLDFLGDLDMPLRFISGNCDRYVLAQIRGAEPDRVPAQVQQNIRWVAEQLRPEDERLLASCPATLRLEIAGLGAVLFCHATPRNDTEIFTRLTSEEKLLPVFEGVDARIVVCGHTHMQLDRVIGGTRVVNAGSVGMPFGAPGADWLVLGPEIELRHTKYDLATAVARIRNTAYPQADDFAAHNILEPPTEEAMLAAFAGAELA